LFDWRGVDGGFWPGVCGHDGGELFFGGGVESFEDSFGFIGELDGHGFESGSGEVAGFGV